MNADRIMVVTGGELVEEGSHEELIQANGKYAELWSKQIFVKPQDKEDSGDDTSRNRKAAVIVNDLPSDMTKLELAKVKNTQKRAKASGSDASESDDTSGSEDSEDSTDTLVTPSKKEEV